MDLKKYRCELLRYHPIAIPYSIPFKEMKSQLHQTVQRSCLKRIFVKEPLLNCDMDMPSVDEDDWWTEEKTAICDAIAQMDANPTEDPTPILENLLTQQTMMNIRTRCYKRFSSELVNNRDHLTQAVGALVQMPSDERHKFLKIVCRERNKSIAGTILLGMITESVKDENYQDVCREVLDLADKYEIDLMESKVDILEPCASQLTCCFLLTELLMELRGFKRSIIFFSSQKIIHRVMTDNYSNRPDFELYGKFLLTIFYDLYRSRKWRVATHLINFNLQCRPFPPKHISWISLGFANIVEDGSPDDVLDMARTLEKKGIFLPDNFQRMAFVKLHRTDPVIAKTLFQLFTAYELCKTPSVNFGCRIFIRSGWTMSEIYAAIEHLDQVLDSQGFINILKLIISVRPPMDENYKEIAGILREIDTKYLKNEESYIERIEKVLAGTRWRNNATIEYLG